MSDRRPASLLRKQAAVGRVTNVELFFDLVYVFAVTQLSHYLLAHQTPAGAFQTALLLGMVWLAWVYTTWSQTGSIPTASPCGCCWSCSCC